MNNVLDKTEKGRSEIATRSHHLTSRLRTLLLLVDGKTSHDQLLKTVSGLGMNSHHLQELIDQGFITSRTENGEAALEPVTDLRVRPDNEPIHPPVQTLNEETEPAAADGKSLSAQIQAAHQFYNETIKAHIGLRGIGLQLKVERAATLEDYRALRQPFLDAVLKHKGEEVASALNVKLQAILKPGKSASSDT